MSLIDEVEIFKIVARQKTIADELQRIVSNIKKDGPARKTAEYRKKRIQSLETLWIEFHANHQRIESVVKQDTPYVQAKTYERIHIMYEEVRQSLQDDAETEDLPLQEDDKAGTSIREDTGTKPKLASFLTDSNSGIVKALRRQNVVAQSLQRFMASLTTVDDEAWNPTFCSVKITALQNYWTEMQNAHRLVFEQTDDPTKFGYNVQGYYELEDEVQSYMVELASKSTNLEHSNSTAPLSKPNVNLPNITLPKFDGDYLKWRQFKDLFNELINKQPIGDCQKLFYLKTTLTGEAEKLIKHFVISDSNYGSAWKVISERYENPRLLVTAQVNKILSQPVIQSEGANAIKTMHDTTQECLLSLKNLDIETSSWDPLLMPILLKKLDKNTLTLWEQSLTQPKALPALADFLSFLETRFHSLETFGNKVRYNDEQSRRPTAKAFPSISTGKEFKAFCSLCKNKNHKLYGCQRFLQLTPQDRLNTIRKLHLCLNCFSSRHDSLQCPRRNCLKCLSKHNTLLHIDNKEGQKTSVTTIPPSTSTTAVTPRNKGYVFLSTVVINIEDQKGAMINCRALLDSGSQLNFITERLSKRLQFPEFSETMRILGIGEGTRQANKRIHLTLRSRTSAFTMNLEAFILRQITPIQPSRRFNISSWHIPADLRMADPKFDIPGQIDLLIGAELYHKLLSAGKIELGPGLPILQNTNLGWIVQGKLEGESPQSSMCGISINENIQESIEKFWKVEEVQSPDKKPLTTEEQKCEKHFVDNTTRNTEGRFMVRLPFKADVQELGASRSLAQQRFYSLEKRLEKNLNLKEQYSKFMAEYINLGHMEKVVRDEIQEPNYYLPHHCVLKPESSTTKLRVVFDGSAKTSSNVSLNELLSTGPTIQNELFTTLLRFRLHRYVFTADIEKMYRQILVHPEDRKFQLIFWRNQQSEKLQIYQLKTVTYGMTPAPYLAIKCLQKLASDSRHIYPLGAEILENNFYVDDVMTGSNSLAQAVEMRDQLTVLLKTAGFTLRKWCANEQRLLKNIPEEDVGMQLDLDIDNTTHTKTLGQGWIPKSDTFVVNIQTNKTERVTKRTALSDIAQLYDPLGFLGPVIITAKIFLQQLWVEGFEWDSPLPKGLEAEWLNFRDNLNHLRKIQIDRHIFAHHTPSSVQVHAFADASEKAYGAAIYIRAINKDKTVTVRLLCTKSKVAPLKRLIIPRLELCAATLAAELVHRVKKDLHLETCPTFLWTDSEIVLSWINSSSSSFHTFVANRIATIQKTTTIQDWRHVRSRDNPADLLSRGIPADKLSSCNLWFYGPFFLHGHESSWPPLFTKRTECDQERRNTKTALSAVEQPINLIYSIDHGNNFRKLQHVVAYVLRYIHNLKVAKGTQFTKKFGPLKPTEHYTALLYIVKQMQQEEFNEDIKHIQRFSETRKGSPLSSLTPFLNEEGVLRVGGRLESSSLAYEAKHPMLLPYTHTFTRLIMESMHKENLHCGPQALLAITKQKFWPIKGKIISRSIVQQCVRCTKAKPKLLSQIMGNLPPHRVQAARPFLNSGVDFCGPIKTHFKVRGKHPQKTYIAVFCCFATKAVHLELVTDLSTNGFIGAIKRFIGRRGNCQHLYCDNATNFVGANNQLQELTNQIHAPENQDRIQNAFSSKGIEFHFIPPRAPHFGGLWEAAVKSAKHLLHRYLGTATLTYEELETVIIEIEAVLNSRPITAMSNDPNDLTALTPGHFIIGEPLTNPTDPTEEEQNINLPAKLKVITNIKEDFWKRWHLEYLTELQHRHKWQTKSENLLPGTMVIIKEDNCPVMKWPLGRVTQTIPGADGFVRVAEIQTANSIIRRPIHRLSPLPVQIDEPNETIPTPTFETEDGEIIDDDDIKPPTKRRKGNPFMTSSTVFLAMLLCLPLAMGNHVKVSVFTSQPGIYFENLGTATISSSSWDIIAYYDMKTYWAQYKSIDKYKNNLIKICQMLPNQNETCKEIIPQIMSLSEDLKRGNELLSPNSHNSVRVRRAAFNFIGNIANGLFGILDSEYADKMSESINKLQRNDDHLLHLIRNQTSIIDATMNILQQSQQETTNNFLEIDKELQQFATLIDGIRQKHHQDQLRQFFNTIAIQLILALSQVQKTQTALIDVLIDTQHGKINPQLVSPAQLRREFLLIKSNLPSTHRLPVSQDEVLTLYHLMSIHGRAVKDHLIFKITLPLISLDEFELFKVTPVPTLINGTFFTINPSTKYIMATLHRDQYYPLSEAEFQQCVSYTTEGHICNQHHPIYKQGAQISSCEFVYLSQGLQSPTCQLIITSDGPHWIQLCNPNEWIYVLKERTTLNIVCNGTVTQTTLEGTGKLRIDPSCVIKTNLITLRGHSIFPSFSRNSISPQTNLSNTFIPDQPDKLVHNALSVKNHLRELNTLKQQIHNLTMSLPSNDLSTNDVHQFTVGYLGLLVSIIILIFLLRRLYIRNFEPNTNKTSDNTATEDPKNITFEMLP